MSYSEKKVQRSFRGLQQQTSSLPPNLKHPSTTSTEVEAPTKPLCHLISPLKTPDQPPPPQYASSDRRRQSAIVIVVNTTFPGRISIGYTFYKPVWYQSPPPHPP
ncbi:hypothetical protein D9758_011021 [Tetrapyrgos nigripes]|uniref:Uncharacterized protein n=1 Tax=Tetrapyrgos nigripes TaxID=182062 RepID=A0A8H5GHK5_9AGAR|nr:hypothetical protein D9758_011021 [Tetrapyrgos nigripes]